MSKDSPNTTPPQAIVREITLADIDPEKKAILQEKMVREITLKDLETPAGEALMRYMIDGEKVHPIPDHEPIKNYIKRLARDNLDLDGPIYQNHCYGLFHPETDKLSAAVYVKLMKLPSQKIVDDKNGRQEVVPDKSLPGNISGTLSWDNAVMWEDPNTAIYYSISSFPDSKIPRILLNGMRPAEYLIKTVAEERLGRTLGKLKHSTLSPLRQRQENKDGTVSYSGLRLFLENQFLGSSNPAAIFTSREIENINRLAKKFGHADTNDVGIKFLDLVACQRAPDPEVQFTSSEQKIIQNILHALAVRYLIEESDGVGGFHLGNGAKIANIHVKHPDETTELEWDHAFGVMVNYVYELDKVAERKEHFSSGEANKIAVSGHLMAEYKTRKAELALTGSHTTRLEQSRGAIAPYSPLRR